MEAFAELQIVKRKKQQALAEQRALEEAKQIQTLSAKEQEAINRTFGYPLPPHNVFTVGKSAFAGVWWEHRLEFEDEEPVTGWEVLRYRRDPNNPASEWQYKGSTSFDVLMKYQVLIEDLTNGFQYRFTVKAKNSRGFSGESPPSEAVTVDKPLPPGWFRIYDKPSKRFYFTNFRTKQSSWHRPDHSKWFLDEWVALTFNEDEIKHLRHLYEEDTEHYECITIDQFMDALAECGERILKRSVMRLFRGYNMEQDLKTGLSHSEESFKLWRTYMDIMSHIKQQGIKGSLAAIGNSAMMAASLFSRGRKTGDWIKTYDAIAGKNCYTNVVTKEYTWDIPQDIKFHILPATELIMYQAFGTPCMELFKQYFSIADVDNNGSLSAPEFKIMLNALGLDVGTLMFNRLLKAVDTNRNKIVEFHEFCIMMYELCKEAPNGIWRDVAKSIDPLRAMGDLSQQQGNWTIRRLRRSSSIASMSSAGTGENKSADDNNSQQASVKSLERSNSNASIASSSSAGAMVSVVVDAIDYVFLRRLMDAIHSTLDLLTSGIDVNAIPDEFGEDGVDENGNPIKSRKSQPKQRQEEMPNGWSEKLQVTAASIGGASAKLAVWASSAAKEIKILPEVDQGPHGLHCFCGCRGY